VIKSYPAIFDSDKRQRFGISDNGEFIDNTYREQDPSRIVGKIIGRNQVVPHQKKVYTTADIVSEMYLYKRGSWMQNWKKRYFVLRKDIRSICYYDSRESLTLLGSIPLDSETVVKRIDPKAREADGNEHVIMMRSEAEDGSEMLTYIRFDDLRSMVAWEMDIRNEALQLTNADEEQSNWWSATFDQVAAVELKSNAVRRDGQLNDQYRRPVTKTALPAPPADRSTPGGMFPPRGVAGDYKPAPMTKQSSIGSVSGAADGVSRGGVDGGLVHDSDLSTVIDETPKTNAEEAVINSMMSRMMPGLMRPSSATIAEDQDSDMDSDNEDIPVPNSDSPHKLHRERSGGGGIFGNRKLSEDNKGAAVGSNNRRTQAQGSFGAGKKKRQYKIMKPEKPPGPPPFSSPVATKFESGAGSLSGLQISLRLCNVCAYQDRIFVVVFGNTPKQQLPPSAPSASSAVATTSIGGSGSNAVTLPIDGASGPSNGQSGNQSSGNSGGGMAFAGQGSRWTQLSCTEVRSVEDKPIYGENYVSDYSIHFTMLQELIPEDCKEIRFIVYRQENDMNYNEPAKASNLNMQLEMAKCIIPRKLFDSNHILKVGMQVKMEIPMDIAVPLFKEAEVQLGIVRMASKNLFSHRAELTRALDVSPYSEMMYSFVTTTGKTLSLEQLYVSQYSVSVPHALMKLRQRERKQFFSELLIEYRAELDRLSEIADNNSSSAHRQTPLRNKVDTIAATAAGIVTHAEDPTASAIEKYLHAVGILEDALSESKEAIHIVLRNCDNMEQKKNVLNNVIDTRLGGNVLRRSVWKKYTAWQYSATNLNIHTMTSKHFTFSEVLEGLPDADLDMRSKDKREECWRGAGSSQHGVYCTPTITMGCPAAHEMKFSDGGLRKIFSEISDNHQKLRWMEVIQAPGLTALRNMMKNNPKEAQSLFGSKASSIHDDVDVVHLLKRKMELARRLDMCGSQALCAAVTTVRTVCILASQFAGKFMDVLSRSLKIGFVVMFESMLSTQGAELGMIEDLDISSLWLSLVTMRLVVRNDENVGENATSSQGGGSAASLLHAMEDGDDDDDDNHRFAIVGVAEGICCRRDMTGRIVIDVEISEAEGLAVMEAQRHLGTFAPLSVTPQDIPMSPLMFNRSPSIQKTDRDKEFVVYATAELFGIAFTQGVNEMQTLANLSSSREVFRQVEINNAALVRLEAYYANYRSALVHQLESKKPELLNNLNVGIRDAPSNSPLVKSVSKTNEVVRPSLAARLSAGLSMSESAVSGKGGGANADGDTPRTAVRRHKSLRQSLLAQDQNGEVVAAAVNTLATKVVNMNDRLMDEVKSSIAQAAINPHEKNVNVLLKTSALCRQMGAIVSILCKSGKDRTSMGVTLENTRSLVEELGILSGKEACQTMRMQGVRRMNVYANTGQSMFAFNQIQKIALPNCYRPPAGCHSGNVVT